MPQTVRGLPQTMIEIGGQWVAQQVRDGHLRMAMLHRPLHFFDRINRQHAHRDGTGCLAPARAAYEKAFAPRRKS